MKELNLHTTQELLTRIRPIEASNYQSAIVLSIVNKRMLSDCELYAALQVRPLLRALCILNMNKVELAEAGKALAIEIDELSKKYHVKSDQHEILIWEADILRAKSQDLLNDSGLSENLQTSTLISSWGEGLAKNIPAVANKVIHFHKEYAAIRNT